MKSFKEILAEARMVATGDYRISASGRKVRRLIKVGDDEYSKAKDIDNDGDNDENDEKAAKMRGESVELEHIDEANEYKVYSNSHNNPEHHTKHSTLDSAKAELAKHQGGALYHKNKLYNKKTGMFESVQIDEAKAANTQSARTELGKRPVKPLTGKDAEDKKKESDSAWERLMAYASSQGKPVKEELEELEDGTFYDGSDMLGEAQARYSSSYQFTHKPGDAESEKKLADLKAAHKGTGKRVVLQGRLGKDNPNAHKYSKANWGKPGSASSGAHTHQRIKKADAAHHDVYVYDKADTQYDADTISEAVTVKKDNYSWGKMVTVHHGSDTSYPLHPEHQSLIKKLKDGEHASFTDETNRKVTAHREGDSVHLSSKGTNKKTTVAHSHFNESVNKSDVPAFLRKKNGDKLTLKDLDKERTQNRSHPETIKKINGTDVKESADNDSDDVPFDKPYKKVDKEVTTDKSGAKHTAMSKARHLARMAVQQQAKKKQG
jgi:hypothetical protein